MNRDDLESLVHLHQAEIYRYVRYLGAEVRGVAEDLVQDTFLAAFRSDSVPPFDDHRRQAAWLRGVARNVWLMHCRKARRDPVLADTSYLERAEGAWVTDFLRDGDGFDYMEALRKCLARLPEKERRVLDLRYRDDKSRSEMAAILQMSEDGIKSSLYRIRAVLKDCIMRRLETEKASL